MRKLKLDELGRMSVEEYKASPKLPVILVLDNIRSAHNVGSIFRTADCLGIERIILTGITAQPPHREIHKTAIGATESVDWNYATDPVDVLNDLDHQGYRVLIAEQTDASIALNAMPLQQGEKLAVVIGNEVDGVSDEVVAGKWQSVEIPQFGTKHSFNVAVSAGIIIWEISRKLRKD